MRNWGREDQANSTRESQIDRETPLPGVIDTIGFGFAALTLRPLAILPLVLLDLYLLFGPRVTFEPLSTQRISPVLWNATRCARIWTESEPVTVTVPCDCAHWTSSNSTGPWQFRTWILASPGNWLRPFA